MDVLKNHSKLSILNKCFEFLLIRPSPTYGAPKPLGAAENLLCNVRYKKQTYLEIRQFGEKHKTPARM